MLNFCSLYSGSSGNCLFVESDNTKLLIDAGVSLKKIEEGLDTLEVPSSSIDAILVTHEHSDHIKNLANLSKKYDIPVYSCIETFDAMPMQTNKISEYNINKIKVGEHFSINDLDINPFSIPHDAANPCGFTISNKNKKIGIATDIGHMTKQILRHLEGSDFVLLESNYEPEVLRACRYPFILKRRISGPNGHLSNEEAGKTINYLLHDNLKSAILGHLSKESNLPELAYQTVIDEIISNGTSVEKINLSVASRDNPGKLIHI